MITAQTLKRLATLRLAPEAMQEVLSIVAEIQGAEDDRLARQRERKRKSRDSHGTVTEQGRDAAVTKERSPTPPKENTTPLVAKATNAPKGAGTRGKRLSEDWKPSSEAEAWAIALGLSGSEITFETDAFRDHFMAAASAKAVKLDWERTWKNWMREAKRRQRKPNGASTAYVISGPRRTWAEIKAERDAKGNQP